MYSCSCGSILSLFSTDQASSCYNGEARLANPDNDTSGFSEDTSGFLEDTSGLLEDASGFLEVCYEGVWVSVCLSNSSTNTSQLAELACRNIVGPSGMSLLV